MSALADAFRGAASRTVPTMVAPVAKPCRKMSIRDG
jgi:hypothetical protein